jgi:4-hydroxy-4-methyl-2-oxoglutarate aldolase
MYVVEKMPPQVDAALIEKLSRVEPATIGHFRHSGFMDPDLRPVIADAPIVAGTAVTLQVPNLDGTIAGYALKLIRPGDILVIDRCGDNRHAVWGGAMAVAAQMVGLAAVIVDGRVCDFGEIRDSGVNVWCRGPTAITCKRTGAGGALNIPVACGGVAVRPGDVVVADDSGIVVLDPAEAEAAADKALAMQDEERTKTVPRMRAGEHYADINGATAIIEAALREQGR